MTYKGYNSGWEEGRKKLLKELNRKIEKMKKHHPDYDYHVHIYTFENRGKCGICGMSWNNSTKEGVYNNALSEVRKLLK